MSMPVNGDYTFHIDKLKIPTHERAPPSSLPFPYSAMWLAHECQTTWQNMEMDTGKFRNAQDSGTCNRYVSGRKNKIKFRNLGKGWKGTREKFMYPAL